MTVTKLKYKGITLPIHTWSDRLGIPLATIRKRLAAGKSAEEALARHPVGVPLYNYMGKTQPLAAWAKELGIPLKTIERRMAEGQSFVQAVRPDDHYAAEAQGGTPLPPKPTKSSIFDMVREVNAQGKTVGKHREEKPHQLPFVPRGSKRITYKGRTMSAIGWAQELGLTPQCIYLRLAKGLPIEKVLGPFQRGRKGRNIEPQPQPAAKGRKGKAKPQPVSKARKKAKPASKGKKRAS